MAYVIENAGAPSLVLSRIATFFDHLAHLLAQRGEERRVYQELNGLSERELSDIGLARYQIKAIAHEAGQAV